MPSMYLSCKFTYSICMLAFKKLRYTVHLKFCEIINYKAVSKVYFVKFI